MAINSRKSIKDVFKRLKDSIDDAVKPASLKPIAEFTIKLIVKRTRLGYGVAKQFGSKARLKELSLSYKEFRKDFKDLSPYTSARKSNLTLTGQMLTSMRILFMKNKKITIGPDGQRNDSSKSNAEIADFQAKKGRVFNRVSALELNQIVREYRRSFGDLLKKKRLLK